MESVYEDFKFFSTNKDNDCVLCFPQECLY